MFGWLRTWLRNRPRLVEVPGRIQFSVRGDLGDLVSQDENDQTSDLASQSFPSFERLVRVIPVGHTGRISAGEMTLTALELFDDGAIIRFFVTSSKEVREEAESFQRSLSEIKDPAKAEKLIERRPGGGMGWFRNQRIEVKDDAGNRYRALARSIGGSVARFEGNIEIIPGVLPQIHQLQVEIIKFDTPWTPGGAEAIAPAIFVIDL